MLTSREARGEAVLPGPFWPAIELESTLSMEARAGTSRLWRGLDVVDCLADDVSGFWVEAAFLAATALASLSCSRSGFRFVDADLEGAAERFLVSEWVASSDYLALDGALRHLCVTSRHHRWSRRPYLDSVLWTKMPRKKVRPQAKPRGPCRKLPSFVEQQRPPAQICYCSCWRPSLRREWCRAWLPVR